MELRWLEKKIPEIYNENGEVMAVRIEKVLQYRNMFGWQDVPTERESMNGGKE